MTARTYQLVCDNIVWDGDGRAMITETMFSAVSDLSTDHGELLARLHPLKKELFDHVHAGSYVPVSTRTESGRVIESHLHHDIKIYVSTPRGETHGLDYSTVLRSQSSATGEAHGHGFDANAEPVIRQMPDRSFRLIFCSLPPIAHRLGQAFDMDHFGQALLDNCKAEIKWDDRDVFWISKSASADQIREVLAFVKSYEGR